MSLSYRHTYQALAADRPRYSRAALLVLSPLLLGWLGWLLLVRVPVYESSPYAVVRAQPTSATVSSVVDGRVVSHALAVGRSVEAGEVLVELDARSERLRLAEIRTRLSATESEVRAREEELRLALKADSAAGVVDELETGEGRAAVAVARGRESVARLRSEELARLEPVGGASGYDVAQATRQVAIDSATRELAEVSVRRQAALGGARSLDRQADVAGMARAAAETRSRIETLRATARSLEQEIEDRVVRAPGSGVITVVADLQPGMVVESGAELARLSGAGALTAVADFAPSALGRVEPGQPAVLRLESYPWMQHGEVGAEVRAVAREVRDGTVRVEMALRSGADAPVPAHGLTGTARVEVDRVRPLSLLLQRFSRNEAP